MSGCALLGIKSDANNSELDSSSSVQRVTAWTVASVGSSIMCPRCKRWIKTQWGWMNHRLSLWKLFEEKWKMPLFGTGSKVLLIVHPLAELMNETARSQLSHYPEPCHDLPLQWVGLQLPLGCSEKLYVVVRESRYSHHSIIGMIVSEFGPWGYHISSHVCTWKDLCSWISQTVPICVLQTQRWHYPKKMLLDTGVSILLVISNSAALGSVNSISPSRRENYLERSLVCMVKSRMQYQHSTDDGSKV